jgi:hypothetical protein
MGSPFWGVHAVMSADFCIIALFFMRQSFIENFLTGANHMSKLQRVYKAIRKTTILSKHDARYAAIRIVALASK